MFIRPHHLGQLFLKISLFHIHPIHVKLPTKVVKVDECVP